MRVRSHFSGLGSLLMRLPDAMAILSGSKAHPNLSGVVNFYQTDDGVVVAAEVMGLPYEKGPCAPSVFGFHIHEGRSCTGTKEDTFANALDHYNPHNCPHPQHAGDLPPLFGNKGYALMTVLTDRFTVNEIVGRTIIIHSNRDDFTSQPSGDSGTKIACGRITRAV